MANVFYNPSGNPATGSGGLSALMRGEFVAIGLAFDMMPQISTTGVFSTVLNQLGNFTFTLPSAPGTLATTANVATETARATAAESVLTAADAAEVTARNAADAAEVTARNAAIGVETTRATAAEGVLTTAVSTETGRATTAEGLLAPKASPALTGAPTAPTAAPGTNTTQLSTTAFSAAAVAVETARATAAEGVNATAALAAAGFGRNRIHNGGFGINQRGYVSGAALLAGVYGHDRWKAGAGGCTYTFTQIQPTTAITITVGTLQQVIEDLVVEGGTYTLSWIGTATARVNAGSYLASPITVAGLSANTALTVEFNLGSVDRAQFEPGSVASTFPRRSYRYELAECQRFYQTGQGFFAAVATLAGQQLGYAVPFIVTMRAAPTVAMPSPSLTNATSLQASQISVSSFIPNVASVAAGASGFNIQWTASADL